MSAPIGVSALAEPILALLESFGSSGAGPAAETLRAASAAVDDVRAQQKANKKNVARQCEVVQRRKG
ncbi:hypothetical protein, partial [Nocardia sp. NPDC004722]